MTHFSYSRIQNQGERGKWEKLWGRTWNGIGSSDLSKSQSQRTHRGDFRRRKELEVARAVVRFDVWERRGRRIRRFRKRRFKEGDGSGGEDREASFFLPGETRHSIDLYHSHTRSLIPGGINRKGGEKGDEVEEGRSQYWQVPHGRTQVEMRAGKGTHGWKGVSENSGSFERHGWGDSSPAARHSLFLFSLSLSFCGENFLTVRYLSGVRPTSFPGIDYAL